MAELLARIFIKNFKDTENPSVRRAYGVMAGIFGIVMNILLFTTKLIVGFFCSSVAIITDAVNNLSDAASSIMTLIGFKLSGKPADADHPYGHERLEYLFGLFVSLTVAVLGIEMLKTSIEKIASGGGSAEFSPTAIILLTLSVAAKVYMAIFNKRLGKKINSDALTAVAADSASDVITTSAIIVGMLLSPLTGVYTDGVLGCLVSIYIIVTGIKLVVQTSSPLIGNAPSAELVRAIADCVKSNERILGIHDIMIHSYGAGKQFCSLHAELDAQMNIVDAHDMIDNIEKEIAERFSVETVIHMDPIVTNDELLNSIRGEVAAAVCETAAHFKANISMHDFRMVHGITHSNLIFDIVLPADCKIDEALLDEQIKSKIKEINPTYNAVITIDRNYISRHFE